MAQPPHSLATGAACVALRGATGQSSPTKDVSAPGQSSPTKDHTNAEDLNRGAARVGVYLRDRGAARVRIYLRDDVYLRDESVSPVITYVSFSRRVTGQPSSC
jgi:hypothetical protein